MNTLDSRLLRIGDCYAQKFAKAGTYRYSLSPSHQTPLFLGDTDDGYVITVQKRSAKGEPGHKTVHVESRDGSLVPDVHAVTIDEGDIVVWYTTDPKVAGFAVIGSGEGLEFSNVHLRTEAVYSHAFGSPGKFRWIDPSNEKISGSVEVTQPEARTQEHMKAWAAKLETPTTVEIRGGKVTPARVSVLVGQTVFWKVWDGPGVAITETAVAHARRE